MALETLLDFHLPSKYNEGMLAYHYTNNDFIFSILFELGFAATSCENNIAGPDAIPSLLIFPSIKKFLIFDVPLRIDLKFYFKEHDEGFIVFLNSVPDEIPRGQQDILDAIVADALL